MRIITCGVCIVAYCPRYNDGIVVVLLLRYYCCCMYCFVVVCSIPADASTTIVRVGPDPLVYSRSHSTQQRAWKILRRL